MSRAKDYPARLTEEEIFTIFDTVERGNPKEARERIRGKLHLRPPHRKTVTAVFNVGLEFFKRGPNSLNVLTSQEVDEIAEKAGYGVSPSRVVELHRLYQLWKIRRHEKTEALGKQKKISVSEKLNKLGEGLLGLVARLHDILSRISAKDQAVWQFPDATWYLDIESTDEHPAELRCQYILGELKVDLKLEIEDRNKFQELLLYLEAMYPEFVFQEFKQRLAALIGSCQVTCREIWHEAESRTGMKTVRPLIMGPVDGLYNMPEFIYNFALDHYDNFFLDPHFDTPRLMVQAYKDNLYKITPEGKPDYKLAVGSKEAMTKCSKDIISLCQKYVQSAKIGIIGHIEAEVQEQAKLMQKVLSEILDQARG